MSYSHCKGCGIPLCEQVPLDYVDGLCSATAKVAAGYSGTLCCYTRFHLWRDRVNGKQYRDVSPEHAVAIDEWLEKGMP